MHAHTPAETTAISDDLVLEGLGYKPGTESKTHTYRQGIDHYRTQTFILLVWNDRIRFQRFNMVGHPNSIANGHG